jgi:hypothetical protein
MDMATRTSRLDGLGAQIGAAWEGRGDGLRVKNVDLSTIEA